MRAQQHLGVVMRRRRDDLGVTQQIIADRSGFDRSYIADLERGKENPKLTTILAVARALNLEPSAFMRLVHEAITRDLDPTPEPERPPRGLKKGDKRPPRGAKAGDKTTSGPPT